MIPCSTYMGQASHGVQSLITYKCVFTFTYICEDLLLWLQMNRKVHQRKKKIICALLLLWSLSFLHSCLVDCFTLCFQYTHISSRDVLYTRLFRSLDELCTEYIINTDTSTMHGTCATQWMNEWLRCCRVSNNNYEYIITIILIFLFFYIASFYVILVSYAMTMNINVPVCSG